MNSFHFLRPEWLLALVPVLFILWQLMKMRGSDHAWRKACDPHLLTHLLIQSETNPKRVPLFLLACGWILTVIALSGPTWSRLPETVYRNLSSRVIVLDVSPQMLADDIKPNRITRAKFKVQDLLNAISDGQVGMVAFSQQAFTVSPLTQDAATIGAMVPELDPTMMPIQGNSISAGLQKAMLLLQQAGASTGEIILITGNTPTTNDLAMATKLKQQGYHLMVLAIGTANGSPVPTANGYLHDQAGAIITSKLDFSALAALARNGGGSLINFSNDNSDLQKLLRPQSGLTLQAEKTQQTVAAWRDQGRWFLLACLPLAALGFRKGWLS